MWHLGNILWCCTPSCEFWQHPSGTLKLAHSCWTIITVASVRMWTVGACPVRNKKFLFDLSCVERVKAPLYSFRTFYVFVLYYPPFLCATEGSKRTIIFCLGVCILFSNLAFLFFHCSILMSKQRHFGSFSMCLLSLFLLSIDLYTDLSSAPLSACFDKYIFQK